MCESRPRKRKKARKIQITPYRGRCGNCRFLFWAMSSRTPHNGGDQLRGPLVGNVQKRESRTKVAHFRKPRRIARATSPEQSLCTHSVNPKTATQNVSLARKPKKRAKTRKNAAFASSHANEYTELSYPLLQLPAEHEEKR